MGSMIHLALGRLNVDWGGNEFFNDHGQLFQSEDLKKIPYYYAEDHVDYRDGFGKPLRKIVDRLELLGYTLENARKEYNQFHQFHEWDEHPLPFDTLAEALKKIDVNKVNGNYSEDHAPEKFVRRDIIDHLSLNTELDIRDCRVDHWEIDLLLENFSACSRLRLLAENPINLDLDVCWGFNDVVEGGWVPRDTFSPESSPPKRFLIVTEGSSDAKIIQHAIKLLRPHISDFFRFVDMEEGYPFSGTGNLFKFTQGLVSIGVQNNTIVVYDNDAEGVSKLNATQKLNLPSNMRAIRLPDLTAFLKFSTVGPNGSFKADINGRAASIECYLDLNFGSHPSPLVRWSSYFKDSDCYQGTLEKKTAFMKTFLDLREIADGYNFAGIDAVLDLIVEQCVEIAELST